MGDILVATGARPQSVDSDERLGEREQQMPVPNQRGRGGRRRGHQSGFEIAFSLPGRRWGGTWLPGSSQVWASAVLQQSLFLVHSWSNNCYLGFQSAVSVAIRAAWFQAVTRTLRCRRIGIFHHFPITGWLAVYKCRRSSDLGFARGSLGRLQSKVIASVLGPQPFDGSRHFLVFLWSDNGFSGSKS